MAWLASVVVQVVTKAWSGGGVCAKAYPGSSGGAAARIPSGKAAAESAGSVPSQPACAATATMTATAASATAVFRCCNIPTGLNHNGWIMHDEIYFQHIFQSLMQFLSNRYRFRSNSDLCPTGGLRQMPPGVAAYGILFGLNLYSGSKRSPP